MCSDLNWCRHMKKMSSKAGITLSKKNFVLLLAKHERSAYKMIVRSQIEYANEGHNQHILKCRLIQQATMYKIRYNIVDIYPYI